MTTHSSILAWRIPMDRGTWWARVHGVAEWPLARLSSLKYTTVTPFWKHTIAFVSGHHQSYPSVALPVRMIWVTLAIGKLVFASKGWISSWLLHHVTLMFLSNGSITFHCPLQEPHLPRDGLGRGREWVSMQVKTSQDIVRIKNNHWITWLQGVHK